jgi:hypothetical protein
MGYAVEDKLLREENQAIGNSAINQVISDVFRMSDEDALNFICRVTSSVTTVGSGITATLQESFDGSNWVATDKTVAITGNGVFEMAVNAFDAESPLAPQCRVVITTAADAVTTITNIHITRRRKN